MKTETCTICGEIVYVEEGEQSEWKPGAIFCSKLSQFFCDAHKPCCACEPENKEGMCRGLEDSWDDEEEYDEEEWDELEDLDVDMEDDNG